MCGRARCTLSRQEVVMAAGVLGVSPEGLQWIDEPSYVPSYNLQPGAATPVVRQAGQAGQVVIQTMR